MTTHDKRKQLLNFLDSDDNEFGLSSIATHGFLTATVVGKPLESWLNVLFDGELASIAEETQLALIHWQQELMVQLKNEQPIELPFHDDAVDFSTDSDMAEWAIGFIDAMYADSAEDWFADEDSEDDVAMLTLPMIVLSGIDEDDETLQDLRSDEDMLAQMANNIEGNLTELFLLFHTEE